MDVVERILTVIILSPRIFQPFHLVIVNVCHGVVHCRHLHFLQDSCGHPFFNFAEQYRYEYPLETCGSLW